MSPPPELLNDTQSRFELQMNQIPVPPVVLSCKCRSKMPITIKWFKQKEKGNDGETERYHSSFMEIKYFENFYQPMPTVAVKELEDNLYLSKFTINNVTEESIYVCVAINYYGFSHRNFTIVAKKQSLLYDIIQESDDGENVEESFEEKSFELFFIPLIFFLIVMLQVSAIIYLLIYRRLMKNTNKNNIITYLLPFHIHFGHSQSVESLNCSLVQPHSILFCPLASC